MAFIRMPSLRPFPGRKALVSVATGDVVEGGMRWVWASDRPGLEQRVRFTEIGDVEASDLARYGMAPTSAISASNPPRFEVVKSRAEADEIEARDLAEVARLANGRSTVLVETAKR